MRTIAIVAALLATTSAWAGTKLLRPVSAQKARWSILEAVKTDQWNGKHRITQIGVTRDGRSIHMVMAEGQKVPRIVATKMGTETYKYGDTVYRYQTPKSRVLSAKEIRSLGLLSPSDAIHVAAKNGGTFGKVRGKMEFAGGSRWSGQAYKIHITPKTPVKVKGPYGVWNVEKLERMVNVAGRGETARPIGNSQWQYQPRVAPGPRVKSVKSR